MISFASYQITASITVDAEKTPRFLFLLSETLRKLCVSAAKNHNRQSGQTALVPNNKNFLT